MAFLKAITTRVRRAEDWTHMTLCSLIPWCPLVENYWDLWPVVRVSCYSPALWVLSVDRRAAHTCGAPPGCSRGWRWFEAGCLYCQWCCTPALDTESEHTHMEKCKHSSDVTYEHQFAYYTESQSCLDLWLWRRRGGWGCKPGRVGAVKMLLVALWEM